MIREYIDFLKADHKGVSFHWFDTLYTQHIVDFKLKLKD